MNFESCQKFARALLRVLIGFQNGWFYTVPRGTKRNFGPSDRPPPTTPERKSRVRKQTRDINIKTKSIPSACGGKRKTMNAFDEAAEAETSAV